jgi:predicted transcriptional regulator
MTVVNSKEFVANQKKYFDLAVNDEVFIKRGKNTFHLICTNVDKPADEVVYYEPDEDFYKSISLDELQRRVKEDIHQWYKERNENYSYSESPAVS